MQAQRLNILGAVLLGFQRKTRGGGKAAFSSPISEDLANVLEWGEVPEFLTGAALDGSLHLSNCELTPKEKMLRANSMTLEAGQITEFKTVRRELKGSKGKGFRIELRFLVMFSDPLGCAKLELYMASVGSEKSALRIAFTKEPVQQELLNGDGERRAVNESQLPLPGEDQALTDEQAAAVAEIPTDPNVEYVDRAKERLAARRKTKEQVQ